jgi:hypothetical protein
VPPDGRAAHALEGFLALIVEALSSESGEGQALWRRGSPTNHSSAMIDRRRT